MNRLKKKHRWFVAVIIDHTNGRVLDILESREQSCVVQYFQEKKANSLLAGSWR